MTFLCGERVVFNVAFRVMPNDVNGTGGSNKLFLRPMPSYLCGDFDNILTNHDCAAVPRALEDVVPTARLLWAFFLFSARFFCDFFKSVNLLQVGALTSNFTVLCTIRVLL